MPYLTIFYQHINFRYIDTRPPFTVAGVGLPTTTPGRAHVQVMGRRPGTQVAAISNGRSGWLAAVRSFPAKLDQNLGAAERG